jgi:ribonuclease HI
VHARCDAEGKLVVGPGGFVEFRYQPEGKSYKSRPESFEPVAGARPETRAEPPPKAEGAAVKGAEKRSRVTGKGGVVDLLQRRGAMKAVQLWTDGACSGNPGPAGVGVRFEHGEEVRELSEYLGVATNNIAELTAILRGLEMVGDTALPVDVMTDSEYCIGLLGLGWKPKANQQLVASLRAAYARFSDVQLVKVKGHAGVHGNERADELARQAIASRSTWKG